MENIENFLKHIPQAELLLQADEISRFIPELGKGIVIRIIREQIKLFRERFEKDHDIDLNMLMSSIVRGCAEKKREKLQRVINGTGVLIQTALGRAPLSKEALERLSFSLSGYSNLELDLASGDKGKRGAFAEELICTLTSAEDALIVNNNAAAVFLILNEFANGKEVLVSRGELARIDEGFSIPDIIKSAGARLMEVGTTNITTIDDYSGALTGNSGMILSIHQSNFRIEGQSASPSLNELSKLRNPSLLLAKDIGSGNLLIDARFPKSFEPTISSELAQGADIICFSGDKMLGSCQAGIIAGRKDLIDRLRKNPLMRILRADKTAHFLLQETLIQYNNREIEKIPLWNIIFQNKKIMANKVTRLIKKIKSESKKDYIARVPLKSVFGSGALPSFKIESVGIQIDLPGLTAESIRKRFLNLPVPVAGYILEEKYALDLRTMFDDDIPAVAEAIDALLEETQMQ